MTAEEKKLVICHYLKRNFNLKPLFDLTFKEPSVDKNYSYLLNMDTLHGSFIEIPKVPYTVNDNIVEIGIFKVSDFENDNKMRKVLEYWENLI